MSLPSWRLPPGVTRGAMDYAASTSVARDYDKYHADNPLFEYEEQILQEEFGGPPPAGVIADLGCGSGRALLPLMRQGWRGLAVDLSEEMLAVVREKAEAENLTADCVRANLVEMGAALVPDGSANHAICLFSTLGMIHGRANRRAALGHMRRVLKPGGRLVLHVHNFWFNLRDPGGPGWVLRSLWRGASEKGFDTGDKYYAYRGVPNFFLHVFRKSELRADLASAGLRVRRWEHLDVRRRHALRSPWWLPALRANGWIVVCESTA
ncbi:class I SAM-dependent methyltransferase [Pseudobythopirellula maris]|nr:class I SAM-dependent methyltransferase [Pseudobythopirellula maris]